MAEETQVSPKQYPQYVTDGSHTYLWNDEYAQLLEQGKLRPATAPVPKKNTRVLSARQRTKLEEQRKKALKDAEEAVELLKVPVAVASNRFEEVFGSEPKE